jgi:hypothetical protein
MSRGSDRESPPARCAQRCAGVSSAAHTGDQKTAASQSCNFSWNVGSSASPNIISPGSH